MSQYFLDCDIVIIGAGPAGLAAAHVAASKRARIILIDDNPRPGGQIWRDGPGVHLSQVARRQLQVLQQGNVRYLPATRIICSPQPGSLLLEDAQRGGIVQYRSLIMCCGAQELLLPFPGWTLPGVSGAGGLQALIKNGLPVKGKQIVVAGSGPLLLATAATVRRAGAQVPLILEQASVAHLASFARQLWRWPSKIRQAASLLTSAYRCHANVLEALGGEKLEAVRIRIGGKERILACDLLACGFGLVANTVLASHLGCLLNDGVIAVDDCQRTSVPDHYAAGECTGVGGRELAQIEGKIAGLMACGCVQQARQLQTSRNHWQKFAKQLQICFALNPEIFLLAKPETLVCRCEDVSYAQLVGHADWTSAKLLSRCGMGACQGRVCAVATQALFGWQLPPPRMPLVPVRIATLLLGNRVPPSYNGDET